MTEVVLFHHAQGLTAGVLEFAAELRDAGHIVHVPDVYDGRTFTELGDGIAYAKSVGFSEVLDKAVEAAAELPSDVVYIGMSLGVLPAQQLAQTKPGARGALLLFSFVPPSEFGSWPASVPVQIHGKDADPIFAEEGDLEAAEEFVEAARGHAGAADSTSRHGADAGEGSIDVELFLYPGDEHLFVDTSLAAYDPEASRLLMHRVLDFLAAVDAKPEADTPGADD